MFFSLFSPKWDKKWVLACQSFGVCTARVKLELTDFKGQLISKLLFDFLSFPNNQRFDEFLP